MTFRLFSQHQSTTTSNTFGRKIEIEQNPKNFARFDAQSTDALTVGTD